MNAKEKFLLLLGEDHCGKILLLTGILYHLANGNSLSISLYTTPHRSYALYVRGDRKAPCAIYSPDLMIIWPLHVISYFISVLRNAD